MNVGYQGETHSNSHRAVLDLYPEASPVGLESFPAAFSALEAGEVDLLVLPIENSTTGSVLPVLDRIADSGASIVAEHLVEVRHAVLAHPGATVETIERVHSHPEALTQASGQMNARGWVSVPEHDTAGAVRLVSERGDPTAAALARPEAADDHGLIVLLRDFVDRDHNTTRFVVLEPGQHEPADEADKTSVVFEVAHQPGSLALALTELGLRGVNLTRIESRPTEQAWKYQFYVDLLHPPGPAGVKAVFDPPPFALVNLRNLGSYRSAR